MDTYEDFNLRIVADGTGYRVLAQSLAGEADAGLEIPKALVNSQSPPRSVPPASRDVGSQPAQAEETPEMTGDALFQALLHGPVRRLFDRSLAANPERGLRVRIHIDIKDERLRAVAALPWEMLYCADTFSFLNLDRRTPVVRSLDALQPATPIALQSPLRVLLVMANPNGTSELALSEERSRVEAALHRIGSVHLLVLEHASCKSLRKRLIGESFHIVHFMGHGSFDDRRAEGFVLMENNEGHSEPVSGDVLATLLKQGQGPSLVILNACKTAVSSERGDTAPFSGVAAALVSKGVPAVLAMQTVIGDRAAITLTEEIYERLAAGDAIESAVSEARLALYNGPQASPEWAIPSLFVRSTSSQPLIDNQQPTVSAPSPLSMEAASRQQINVFAPIENQVNVSGNAKLRFGGD